MKQNAIQLNLSQHWRAPNRPSGVKVELAIGRLPGGLQVQLRSLPAQFRFKWDGPHSPIAPVLRIVWGWPLAEGWLPVPFYPDSRNRRESLKFTCSKSRLFSQTGWPTITTGRWIGTMMCDPDEQAARRVSLTVQPMVYKERTESKPIAIPDPNAPLPELQLP